MRHPEGLSCIGLRSEFLRHTTDDYVVPENIHTPTTEGIDHFTVVGLVTWPLNGSEAGGDPVLIQTSLLLLCKSSCSYANQLSFI